MHAKPFVLTLITLLGLSFGASAIEMNYKWKKGDVHRFRYQDDSRVTMKMGGMAGMAAGMDVSMKVKSTFAMKVLKTLPGGKAEVELTIESMDLYQGTRKLPALKKIPVAARKVKATVDRKGRATFHRMVTVYFHDDQVYLGVRKAEGGPGHVSASVSAGGPEGGVEVDLVAHIDPKTGRIVASAKITERPPALRKVKIKQEDPGVDILPKEIFEMMVLPDGDISAGGKVSMDVPGASVKIGVSLDSLIKGVAKLHFKTEMQATGPGDVAAVAAADDAADMDDAGADDMSGMPGMGGMGGMGGMPGMGGAGGMPGMGGAGGMPGMGGGAGGGTQATPGGMEMNTDAHTRFDVKKGRLLG
ncbi:MAG: hypothetical protein JRF33_07805, partial [Deltaproteobacteria bacterium]|nr:hypothetical protein [Deltaproteobacteria bacterium]